MVAIILMTLTKYTCNESNNCDLICLKETKYGYNVYNEVDLIWMQSQIQNGLFVLASILGPNCYFHCKHIWVLSSKLLQPYGVQPYTVYFKLSLNC